MEGRMNLFLIEDDDVDVISITRSLKSESIDVDITRAVDGVEALMMLREGAIKGPFITLLDIQMPRMNGIEFLHEVRKDPNLQDMVVFILTTSQAQQDILESFQRNVAGYFLKSDGVRDYKEVAKCLDSFWRTSLLPQRDH